MQADGAAPKQSPSVAKELAREFSLLLSPALILALIGIVVLGVVGIFGGWERATARAAEELPTAAVDEAVQVDPLSAKILGAAWATRLEGALPEEEGSRYLLLVTELTNTTGEPVHQSNFHKQFTLDVEGLATTPVDPEAAEKGEPEAPRTSPPSNLRVLDSLSQPALQPDLPTQLVLVWKQDDSQPVPRELTVTLHGMTFRESSLGMGADWRDETPAATVTVPVKEMKGE